MLKRPHMFEEQQCGWHSELGEGQCGPQVGLGGGEHINKECGSYIKAGGEAFEGFEQKGHDPTCFNRITLATA